MCNGHRKPLASYTFLSCMMFLCDICHVGVWLCARNSLAVRCPKETPRTAVVLLQAYLCLRFGCKIRSSGDIQLACLLQRRLLVPYFMLVSYFIWRNYNTEIAWNGRFVRVVQPISDIAPLDNVTLSKRSWKSVKINSLLSCIWIYCHPRLKPQIAAIKLLWNLRGWICHCFNIHLISLIWLCVLETINIIQVTKYWIT